MQFSPLSCYFLPLRSKYLLQDLQPTYTSNSVTDQVSSTYKTPGKIMALCNFIFTLLDRKWEDKRFWTEWQQALHKLNLRLVSSRMFLPENFKQCSSYLYMIILSYILQIRHIASLGFSVFTSLTTLLTMH